VTAPIYAPGLRVFLSKGPLIPGVILPPAADTPPGFRLVQLETETDPAEFRTPELIAATLTPGRRVFRSGETPHRYGTIPPAGQFPRNLVKARMQREEDSVIVRWDNGEFELVAKANLTPIVYKIDA